MKFTNYSVRKLPLPSDKPQVIYWEGHGFGVQVGVNGSRVYVAQGRIRGQRDKKQRIVLGAVKNWDLARARVAHADTVKRWSKGEDVALSKKIKCVVAVDDLGSKIERHLGTMLKKFPGLTQENAVRSLILKGLETEKKK